MSETQQPTRVGISCGDLNGVGLEVVLKRFEDARMLANITPLLYCSAKVLTQHRKQLKLDEVQFHRVNDARDALPKKLNLVNLWEEDVAVELGKPLVGWRATRSRVSRPLRRTWQAARWMSS